MGRRGAVLVGAPATRTVPFNELPVSEPRRELKYADVLWDTCPGFAEEIFLHGLSDSDSRFKLS
jgi:hypothetical protein